VGGRWLPAGVFGPSEPRGWVQRSGRHAFNAGRRFSTCQRRLSLPVTSTVCGMRRTVYPPDLNELQRAARRVLADHDGAVLRGMHGASLFDAKSNAGSVGGAGRLMPGRWAALSRYRSGCRLTISGLTAP
jgi:hypothetical protein